ncbi:MAG: hypothetical protein ACO1Q7_11030 [Gemmatimonas sp.]
MIRNAMRLSAQTVAALCVFGSTACLDPVIEGDSTVRGTYVLQTANGAAPPYTLSNVNGVKTEVISGSISLYSGYTYAETETRRVTQAGQVTTVEYTDTGVYGLQNDAIFLTSNFGRGTRITKVQYARVMSFSRDSIPLVYRK